MFEPKRKKITKCELINRIKKYNPDIKVSLLWNSTREELIAYLKLLRSSGKENK